MMADSNDPISLFPIATHFPYFFNENLIDPNRVIKVTSGRQCWIRAFYFQLFKLMFEIQTEGARIKQLEDILIIAAQNMIKYQNSPESDQISQLINSISIFINHLNDNSEVQFEQLINNNKNIDQALIFVFQSIVNESMSKDTSVYEKLKYLGKYFKENMSYFEMGIKYEESDTFLYIQNEEEIYVAYLNISQVAEEEVEQNNDDQQQKQENINDNIQSQLNKNQIKGEQEGRKVSPVEYLFTKKFGSNQQNTENGNLDKNNGDYPINRYNQGFKDTMEIGVGIREYKQEERNNIKQNLKTRTSTEQENDKKKQSIVYHYQQAEPGIVSTKAMQIQTKNSNKQQIFYKPTEKLAMQNLMKNIDSNNSSGLKKDKKDPLDWINEQEKGTFYRKFTDTKILNLIAQPHRTKIKMLKNRFIGIHSHK